MSAHELAPASTMDAHLLEQVVVQGDLSKLSANDRVAYYARVCESLGLNPLTKPFDYINLNGKLVLYAKRDAADQIRSNRNVSIVITARELLEDVYVVTARASTPDGRTDESTGAVAIAGLKGEARANAMMKAETKAKRRVTLSIGGLGWLDETETDSIPGAREVHVDEGTGELIEPPHAAHPPTQAETPDPAINMKALRKRALDILKSYYAGDKDAIEKAVAGIAGRECKWMELTAAELQAIINALEPPEDGGEREPGDDEEAPL